MACKTALRRLDLSELLRRESESAAETAENGSCKSQAALRASQAVLRAAEAALSALDSLRRRPDWSSFPIAVLRVIFAFVCSLSIALVSLSHRSVANSFDCDDATNSDSLLLPRVQCCLKDCLAVFVVARAFWRCRPSRIFCLWFQ